MLKNRRAAIQILEQTFVVIFGVVMLILVILVFSNVAKSVSNYVAEAQFKNIANYVHNGIIQVYINGRFVDNYTVYLDIPPSISSHTYTVIIEEGYVKVRDTMSSINNSVLIYKLNVTINGNISSTSGGIPYLFYNTSDTSITLKSEPL